MHVLWDDRTRALVEEVRSFVKNEVPADLLRRMDREEVRFAKEFIQAAARHNLLGLRFPPEYGGRGLPWRRSSRWLLLEYRRSPSKSQTDTGVCFRVHWRTSVADAGSGR